MAAIKSDSSEHVVNALIEQAISNYPSITAQQAALRQARDNVRAQQGVFFPQVQGQASQARQKQSLAAAESDLPPWLGSRSRDTNRRLLSWPLDAA